MVLDSRHSAAGRCGTSTIGVQGTELLSGITVDRRTGASLITVEGNRRVGDRWRVSLEARSFFAIPETDFIDEFRADDYVQLEIERFF